MSPLNWVLALHQFVYERTDGRVGASIGGRPSLLLTTTGRKTGKPRTVALVYVADGDDLVVVASNGGSDRPPGWLLNLKAVPLVRVQVGRRRQAARARVAGPEERGRLWPAVNEMNKGGYDAYQRKTTREIPLVILEPVGSPS